MEWLLIADEGPWTETSDVSFCYEKLINSISTCTELMYMYMNKAKLIKTTQCTSEVGLRAQALMISKKELQTFSKPSRETRVNQRD